MKLDHRLEKMEWSIENLTQRIARIEERFGPSEEEDREGNKAQRPRALTSAPDIEDLLGPSLGIGLPRILSLGGRSCLVFGGAFLLRALAESGTMRQDLGVVLGLIYAMAWFAAAWRAGRLSDRLSAETHGVTAVAIVFPLLVETTTRLHLISGVQGAIVLVVILLAGFGALWSTPLSVTAWSLSSAGVVSAFLIGRFSGRVDVFTIIIVAGFFFVWGFGKKLGYRNLRWLWAPAADIMLLGALQILSTPGGPNPPFLELSPELVLLSAALMLFSVTGAEVKLIMQNTKIGFFDAAQTAATAAIALGGTAGFIGSSRTGSLVLGFVALAVGLIFYSLAFGRIERQLKLGRAFLFSSSFGLVFLLFGGALALSGAWLGLLWCSFGVFAAFAGGFFDRVTLRAHAAMLIVLASWVSGLATITLSVLFGGRSTVSTSLTGPMLGILAGALCGYAFLVFSHSARETKGFARTPRGVIAAVCVSLAVVAMFRLGGLLAPDFLADPAVLSATITIVLALVATLLAAVGRLDRVRELAWLVYPILVLTGLRFLFVDLRVGRGMTLFPTFVVFGLVLVFTPRLMRQTTEESGVRTARGPSGTTD